MPLTRSLLAAGAALAVAASLAAQAPPVPTLAFDATDLLQTPTGVFVGEVGGVGRDSKGRIFVYTRTGHPYATLGDNRTFARGGSKLFQFDASGVFVRELGQDVYGFNAAFGLRVDPQDNVWTVDEAASQVVKFDAEGRVVLVLGRKPETIAVRPREGGGGGRAPAGPPGAGVPGSSFNRPTDVAWDQAGNIYISDGLGTTNRVAKYDPEGRFIRQWGSTGSAPGQFDGPKALALDRQGNVYVADRRNKRIQVFDGDGTFKSQFGGVGTPMAMCITPGTPQRLFIAHAGDDSGMDDATIYEVALDGTVLGHLGTAGKGVKEFGIANSLDCVSDTELLVGEMTNWRVQRIRLRP